MTWMMKTLQPTGTVIAAADENAKPTAMRKRVKDHTGGNAVFDRLSQLHASERASAPTAMVGVTVSHDDESFSNSSFSSTHESPGPGESRNAQENGTAARWALREAMPPPPDRPLVRGPHGANHERCGRGS